MRHKVFIVKIITVRYPYNAIDLLTTIHKRHPIAHPLGRGMGSLVDPASDWYSASVPVIKSPRVTGELVVLGPFPPPPPSPPTLLNFPGKPLKLIFSNHSWLTYGCWKMFLHPTRWPWVKVTKLPKRDTIYLVPTIKWEPLIQSLQNFVGISPSSCFPPDKILEKFCQQIVFSNFLHKILNPFTPVEHSICHILGMVGPIDVKQKGNESAGCYAD